MSTELEFNLLLGGFDRNIVALTSMSNRPIILALTPVPQSTQNLAEKIATKVMSRG